MNVDFPEPGTPIPMRIAPPVCGSTSVSSASRFVAVIGRVDSTVVIAHADRAPIPLDDLLGELAHSVWRRRRRSRVSAATCGMLVPGP